MGVNTCKIMFMGHFYDFYTLCEEISKFGKKIISTDYLHTPLARLKVASGAKKHILYFISREINEKP